MRKPGLTLIELLVVIAIIGILVLVLLPAIQAGREAARRATCQNNLKQICLALNNFESARRKYPVGARSNVTFGLSWWVDILPFLEEQSLYEQIDRQSPHNGWVLFHAQNALAVDDVVINSLHCPSSPIPSLWKVGVVNVMMPSYVGVAGATSHDSFPETRVATCCVPGNDGEISAGGVLFPNRQIREREVLDGLSKTIALGETSDYAMSAGSVRKRIDGGFPNGWITGTRAVGSPPNYDSGLGRPSWNVTTVRYGPNMRDYDQPGIDDNRGANNPFVSAHPGGVHVGLLGGAVRFVVDDVEVETLKSLATRDDGLTIRDL